MLSTTQEQTKKITLRDNIDRIIALETFIDFFVQGPAYGFAIYYLIQNNLNQNSYLPFLNSEQGSSLVKVACLTYACLNVYLTMRHHQNLTLNDIDRSHIAPAAPVRNFVEDPHVNALRHGASKINQINLTLREHSRTLHTWANIRHAYGIGYLHSFFTAALSMPTLANFFTSPDVWQNWLQLILTAAIGLVTAWNHRLKTNLFNALFEPSNTDGNDEGELIQFNVHYSQMILAILVSAIYGSTLALNATLPIINFIESSLGKLIAGSCFMAAGAMFGILQGSRTELARQVKIAAFANAAIPLINASCCALIMHKIKAGFKLLITAAIGSLWTLYLAGSLDIWLNSLGINNYDINRNRIIFITLGIAAGLAFVKQASTDTATKQSDERMLNLMSINPSTADIEAATITLAPLQHIQIPSYNEKSSLIESDSVASVNGKPRSRPSTVFTPRTQTHRRHDISGSHTLFSPS